MGSLAKLTRPKLHKVLPRQRLFDQLHDCLERPLTWVSGPPGSGKTSLVASYLSSQRTGGFWYHLDAGDGDLATLFHYLALAVETKGRKAVPLPVLSPQHQDDLTGFARVFFRALFQRIKAPAVLVLDNYHELAVDSPLHGLWETIVRELPTGIAMLVISRTPPPPQCAGLRVLDRLSQLEWESLRLTLDETRSFAAARYAVDEETLRGLHESARGWPVGLVLMLERLRRVDDAGDGADQDREVLFDYFAAQIFATLPEATRLVLMRVALLPRASAAQARSVSGQDCAEEVLDRLYRQRLFVDKRGDAYQLHDLFRAFLLAQLQHNFDSAQVRQWRSAAAELMAIEGQVEDAFALACDAGNWRVAAGVLLLHAASTFEQGRSATLLAWIERLPAEVVEANAWLGFWYAVAAVVRSPALSRTRFKETYPRFEAEGNETAMVLCCGGIVTTYYWEFDNLATLEPWIDRLLALLERSPLFPAKAAELRIYSTLLFALSFRRPQPDSLARCIDRIHALLAEDCPANARIDAAALLLAHACNCGDFAQGGRVVALAEPWLSDPDVGPFYRPLWWMQVGHYHGARGDEARAAQAYAEAWTWMERNALTVPLLRVHCQIGLARLALCRGDVEAAESARTATAAYWTAARRIDTCPDTGAPYEQVFFVADVQATGSMVADEINVFLWRSGFHLFFPMRGADHWRIVDILPKELRDRDGLALDDVVGSLRGEAGTNLSFSNCSWFSTYRIHHRHAERFRQGRCFVLGDAAHVHSPVGAQGMNTGLQDAYNLAWKLSLVVKNKADQALLDSYEAERLPIARRLLSTTDRGFQLVVSDHPLAGILRTKVLARIGALAMRFKSVQRLAFRTVSQTGLHYRSSALSATAAGLPAKAPQAGDRFPWLHLALHSGGAVEDSFRMLDDTHFHLLLFGQSVPQGATVFGDLLRIHHVPQTPDNTAEMKRHGIPERSFYLLRPDGHVGLCGNDFSPARLEGYARESLGLARADMGRIGS